MDGNLPAKSRPRALGVLGVFVIVVLLAFLAGAIGFALYAWQRLEGVVISTHGMIAMGLGIVVTTLVGAGLMGLVFWSSRKGYDR